MLSECEEPLIVDETKPDLDTLVALHIVGGFNGPFRCPQCAGTHFGSTRLGRECHNWFCRWTGDAKDALPRYSTDAKAAAWVANLLLARGLVVPPECQTPQEICEAALDLVGARHLEL